MRWWVGLNNISATNACRVTTVRQEENVREWLAMVTLAEMRKFAARCRRFCKFYRLGCSVHLACYATRVYKGHRMAPSEVTLDKIEADYSEWKARYIKNKQ